MDRLAPGISDIEAELTHLRQDNERLKSEAESLRQTAQLVLDEPDTKGLAQSLAQQFGLALKAQSAWVLVLQDQDTVARGAWPIREFVFKFEPGKNAAGRAAKSLQTCIQNDAAGICEIATPIVDHQRRLLGILNASSVNGFSSEHADVAKIFAVQAALGLERARLFDRMRDWTKSLEMLLSFNAIINQHVDPAQLVRHLVESAARFLEADGGRTGLAVPSPASGGTAMISEAYWHYGKWSDRPARWEVNEGIPGFLLESEFSYIANDYREDRLSDRSLIEEFDVCRALCVPIKNMDESLLGFFELLRGPGRLPFTWQDAAFLESLSNTTAVAIHNAQLLKALEIKNEQIQALSANHVKRLEAERSHIARELHDEAGQVMIGIKLGLQVLAKNVPAEPQHLREDLDHLRELVNQSTVQIKDLARRLRPPILDELGLNVTLRQMAADFTGRTRIPVTCDFEDLPERLPADTETTLYRIAQEALTNVARYAGARSVHVSLQRNGALLQFSVQDDGSGFNQSIFGSGLGLLGMRERADMLNAQFLLNTNPGEGTRIRVLIPYEYCPDHSR